MSGSGKTFSMLGKAWTDQSLSASAARTPSPGPGGGAAQEQDDSSVHTDDEDALRASVDMAPGGGVRRQVDDGVGIIPRCLADIYDTLNDRASRGLIDFSIHVQVMQIYNEKIFDLLQDRRRENPLTLREASGGGKGNIKAAGSGSFGQAGATGSVYVQGLSGYRVDTREDVLLILKRAMRNRAVRSTEMNLESSRSHTILQLAIEVRDKGSGREEGNFMLYMLNNRRLD